MPAPICTLVHISDPHFGASFVIDGERGLRPVASRTPGLRHIAGTFPHSYQTAVAVASAVRRILRDCKDRGIPAVLVHTGDLTASGSQAEFSVGVTFLRHGHYLANSTLSGLGLETEFGQLPFDVPGNHDLWNRGSPGDDAAFSSHYGGPYPKALPIVSAAGKVVIYGLDSNRSSLWQHRLANGEIPFADLNSLCETLRKERNSGTVNVVCLHHPLFLRKRGVPHISKVEILTLKSRKQVARSLAEAGAHLVLAGHVHNQQHSNQFGLLHFIAGSACQIGSRPSFWMLDLYSRGVEFTYFHIPKGRSHFEPAESRSGYASY